MTYSESLLCLNNLHNTVNELVKLLFCSSSSAWNVHRLLLCVCFLFLFQIHLLAFSLQYCINKVRFVYLPNNYEKVIVNIHVYVDRNNLALFYQSVCEENGFSLMFGCLETCEKVYFCDTSGFYLYNLLLCSFMINEISAFPLGLEWRSVSDIWI